MRMLSVYIDDCKRCVVRMGVRMPLFVLKMDLPAEVGYEEVPVHTDDYSISK
jgi:hypothetical protein